MDNNDTKIADIIHAKGNSCKVGILHHQKLNHNLNHQSIPEKIEENRYINQ